MELLYVFEISKISGVHNAIKINLPNLYDQFLHISKLYRSTNRHYKPALYLLGLFQESTYIISLVFTKTKAFDTNIKMRDHIEVVLNYETYCNWNNFISVYRFLDGNKTIFPDA